MQSEQEQQATADLDADEDAYEDQALLAKCLGRARRRLDR
jgi:hypothetical protein